MKPKIKELFYKWRLISIVNRGSNVLLEAEKDGKIVKKKAARDYVNPFSIERFGVKVDDLKIYKY